MPPEEFLARWQREAVKKSGRVPVVMDRLHYGNNPLKNALQGSLAGKMRQNFFILKKQSWEVIENKVSARKTNLKQTENKAGKLLKMHKG